MAKIAISLPEATFAALERERKRTGASRSALVCAAIEGWLRARVASKEDQRYVEAYLRQPDDSDDLAAIASAAAKSWGEWE